MAQTYLTLTNKVLRLFGGKEAASATFDTTNDVEIKLAKDSVNAAILDLNMYEFEWPFNVTATTLQLIAGTQRYALDSDTKGVDMDSFLLNKSDALSVTEKWLPPLDYDDWIKNFAERDGNASSNDYSTPAHVFRYPNGDIGVTPIPDQAYTIDFTRYLYPTELSASTDTCRVPDAYSQVIVNGAAYYMNTKRGNGEQAALFRQEFAKGVSRMRSILINDQYQRVKDKRVKRSRGSSGFISNVSL